MKVPQYIYGTIQELQRYFALAIQAMQSALSDNGWTIPQQTNATISIIINGTVVPYFEPVMPAGTIWFNTDVGKLQVLVTAAVPGTSNGVVQTITSV